MNEHTPNGTHAKFASMLVHIASIRGPTKEILLHVPFIFCWALLGDDAIYIFFV